MLGIQTRDNIFEQLFKIRRWALDDNLEIDGWSARIIYREKSPTLLLQRACCRLTIYTDNGEYLMVCTLPDMDDVTVIDKHNNKWSIDNKPLTKKTFMTMLETIYQKRS